MRHCSEVLNNFRLLIRDRKRFFIFQRNIMARFRSFFTKRLFIRILSEQYAVLESFTITDWLSFWHQIIKKGLFSTYKSQKTYFKFDQLWIKRPRENEIPDATAEYVLNALKKTWLFKFCLIYWFLSFNLCWQI